MYPTGYLEFSSWMIKSLTVGTRLPCLHRLGDRLPYRPPKKAGAVPKPVGTPCQPSMAAPTVKE